MKYLFFLFCLINVSLAQAPRQIQFKHVTNTLFSHGKSKIRNIEIKYKEQDKWIDTLNIRLEDQGFSPPLEYQGNEEFGVFIEGSEKPFRMVRVPSGDKLIFLFIATLDPQRPYRIHLINEVSFKFGEYRVFNVSKSRVGIKVGSSSKLIKPNNYVVVGRNDNRTGKPRFPVQFYSIEEGSVRRFSATQWSELKNKRTMVFVYRDPKSMRFTYKGVDDYFISDEKIEQINQSSMLAPQVVKVPKGKDGFPVNPVSLLSEQQIKKLGKRRIYLMNKSHLLDIKLLKRNLKFKAPKRKSVVVSSGRESDPDEAPVYKTR